MGLSGQLRCRVILQASRDVINTVEFFHDKDPQFVVEVAARIRPMFLKSAEVLLDAGDCPQEMTFLQKGTVEMFASLERSDGLVYEVLAGVDMDGSYFGDTGVFLQHPSPLSLRAASFCDMWTISKSDLDVVSFPPPAPGPLGSGSLTDL